MRMCTMQKSLRVFAQQKIACMRCNPTTQDDNKEKEKLKSGLTGAILTEKPNVRVSIQDEQAVAREGAARVRVQLRLRNV
jgi:hypothetical protein